MYELVKNMPMFKDFTEKELRTFCMMEHAYLGFQKGNAIVKEGQQSTALFLLIKGTAMVTKGNMDSTIAKLEPGMVFGEISFLTRRPRLSSVLAEEDVMVLKMDDAFFEKISHEIRDKVKNYLIELLIKRLDTMNETLVKIAMYARGRTLV